MSGCGCGQPVIINGAPAPARVDVETVLLCDVLADGTVAGLALVEPVYDTTSGARVGTRVVDPATGATYTPTGTLGPCAADGCARQVVQSTRCDDADGDGTGEITYVELWAVDPCNGGAPELIGTYRDGDLSQPYTPVTPVDCPPAADCASPTTPVATVGLCLADGTPIAVTVQRDCDGVIISEGWINLTTGTYSAGAPPVGTGACGDSQSVQVSGTFCDVDAAGDVVGLVLVEYSYAADGTIASVRLVDATTGATYTPTGTITVCPAGTEQPEQDAVQLCDTAADGTVTAFLRDYRRDETGAIVGHSDYSLDGAAYTAQGTVGVCQPESCTDCETLVLCDVPTAAPVRITGTAASGTLSNGVTWTSVDGGSSSPMVPNMSNADGSWWGLHSFPHATTAPTRWTFNRPSIVEFSVYVHYYPTSPGISWAQLPAGLEVVELPAGYAYNASTGVLTRTAEGTPPDPCSYVTNPQVATSARFRTSSAVTSVTTSPAPNSRAAVCGTFLTYWAGAVSVVPGGEFLRHICRTCDGTATITDTLLDGTTAYTVAGTAGVCSEPPDCSATQVCVQATEPERFEFLSNPNNQSTGTVDGDWTWSPNLAGPWFPTYQVGVFPGWTTTDPGTAEGTAHWVAPHPNSGLFNTGAAGEGPNVPAPGEWYARASFTLPADAEPSTIRISATALNADQNAVEWRLNGGAWQPVNANHAQPAFQLAPTAVPGVQPGLNEIIIHVSETVAGGGAAGIILHLIAEYQVPEDGLRSWTRMVCSDGTMHYIDEAGARQDALPEFWSVVACVGGSSSSPDTCTKQVVERCGCDDTDGDGVGDVTYTELWAVDPCGGAAPALLGTYLDGDLTQPYTPVAPVECTTADVLPGPVMAGVRNVTGVANQQLGDDFPGLQSVTLTVLSGFVAVTMSSGTNVTIPAGVTMTWSVAKEDDTALEHATFVGTTSAANYLLNWTWK
ncbi:hypothetical protein [Streptomyces sp. NPDC012616]|uniref:hypothetical protein n=1 Tax=Streptomyces sp. NPDC012616 TaxID=3364840 RepID=UPI0036E5B6E1